MAFCFIVSFKYDSRHWHMHVAYWVPIYGAKRWQTSQADVTSVSFFSKLCASFVTYWAIRIQSYRPCPVKTARVFSFKSFVVYVMWTSTFINYHLVLYHDKFCVDIDHCGCCMYLQVTKGLYCYLFIYIWCRFAKNVSMCDCLLYCFIPVYSSILIHLKSKAFLCWFTHENTNLMHNYIRACKATYMYVIVFSLVLMWLKLLRSCHLLLFHIFW